MRRLQQHLTYANVVATLALFVALGGSAYAIGAGTIGSREVRDNSLRPSDIDERRLRAQPRVYRRSVTFGIPRGTGAQRQVDCKRGDVLLSGSVNPIGNFRDPGIEQLYGAPAQGKHGYLGVFRYGAAGAAGSVGFQVNAVCADRPGR